MIKRFVEILIAIAGIVLSAPILIFCAILIKLDSPGSVFFLQKRVGKNGKLFNVYKLRTMVTNAEALGSKITGKDDVRITQIGHLIRWFKIDELPQFINLLKGDMALIGPRPEVPNIVDTYTAEQREVLSVRPGILGTSQVKNRDEASMFPDGVDAEKFYIQNILPEKLKSDLGYVRDKGFFKDFKILFGGALLLIMSSIKWRYIFESKRRFVFLLMDVAISLVTFGLAFQLRFEGAPPVSEWNLFLGMLPFIALIRTPLFVYFGLYQTLWQYLGIQELIAILKAVTVGSILLPFVSLLMQTDPLPRSILIMDWFLLFLALGGVRVFFKITAERLRSPKRTHRKNVLIIGACDTGELLLREFIKHPELGYGAIGFLDDHPDKLGMRIHGQKVFGQINKLSQVAKIKKIDEVIVALSNIDAEKLKEISKTCRDLSIICRIIPHGSMIMSQNILPFKLRNIDISDLLGREIVQTDIPAMQAFFHGKKVLITGGGGSIGSELARIIYEMHPAELIVVDSVEGNLYDLEMDLKGRPTETPVSYYLRDIVRVSDMEKIFEQHKPQIIYHAAAYKHVPMMETNYKEAIMNNVLGTKNIADLALKHEAECFVLISTDKAIRPKSIMGATKRLAELYTQSLNCEKTRFLAVRFGNVFNSRGSVVPLFKKQIEEGLPLTITHPETKRYFMDVSEAVFLILQATIMGSGSQIFMLDMGNSIKIIDLAKEMAQLMGVSPESLQFRFVGLRPGEKLEEELSADYEKCVPTSHKKIKIHVADGSPPPHIYQDIEMLISQAEKDQSREEIIQAMMKIMPEYRP